MNAYTALTILNVAIIAGCVAICFASHSAWGLLGFLFLFNAKKPDYKEASHEHKSDL